MAKERFPDAEYRGDVDSDVVANPIERLDAIDPERKATVVIAGGVPRAYGHQGILAETIIPFVFQEHTVTRASMPKPILRGTSHFLSSDQAGSAEAGANLQAGRQLRSGCYKCAQTARLQELARLS